MGKICKVCVGMLVIVLVSGCTPKKKSDVMHDTSTSSKEISDSDEKEIQIDLDYLSEDGSKSPIADNVVELERLKGNSLQFTVDYISQDYWTSVYIDDELISGPSRAVKLEQGVRFDELGRISELLLSIGRHSVVAAQYETNERFENFSKAQVIKFSKYNYIVVN
ncbi:hypothetical protein IGI37_000571 [Enterococcus sp. AZ194]|uniref:hypothetical protein n=1 Tax=Enterococcus sp. AZ194 TaxID=2774629 RepID=UPI003F25A033